MVLTAGATFGVLYWAFGWAFEKAILLAVIVSSTDAAAIFSILRRQSLSKKLSSTVEIESAANDPMAILLIPKGVPHTYRVESPQGGRCLTVTVHGDFERVVREMSRPAERPELPKLAGLPTNEALQALRATAAKYGVEFVGPPLQ